MKTIKYQFISGLFLVFAFFGSCAEDDFSPGTKRSSSRMQLGTCVSQVEEFKIQTRGESYARPNQPVTWKLDNGKVQKGYAVTMNFIRPKPTLEQLEREARLTPEQKAAATRARSVTTEDFYDDYGLITYEYPYPGTFSDTMRVKTRNEQVFKGRGWMTQEYWPGSAINMTICGYAPYNGSCQGIDLCRLDTLRGLPNMWYSVPPDVRNQSDLLVCCNSNERDVRGDYNDIRNIRFDHVLSSVQIAVGQQMAPCKITRIQIQNVYYYGQYTFGATSWNVNTNYKTSYDANMGAAGEPIEVFATDQNRVLNDGKWNFMLMPQTVPDGAKMIITINDGAEHSIEADLSGHTWEMGCSIIYYLATADVTGEYILTATTPNTLTYSGGRATFSVISYHKTYYGSQAPVPWEATFVLDGDNVEYQSPRDYVTNLLQSSGTGSTTGTSIWYDIAEQSCYDTCAVDNRHTYTLRNATWKDNGSGSAYNMASYKGSANCYVINAPGKYSLPLVYGNTLKANGQPNTSALNLPNICDHHGDTLDTPYIFEKYVPYDAAIIWQDAPGLIDPASMKLTGNSGGRYTTMEFEVPRESICQGNAVIAVRDEVGMVLWSWHIWVTDEKILADTIHTFSIRDKMRNVRFFTQKPIGWCDKVERYYKPRKTEIRLKQVLSSGSTDTPMTASVTIEQTDGNLLLQGRAPYFEWGRKDPMTPLKNTNYNSWDGNNRTPWFDSNTTNNSNYYFYCWETLGSLKYSVQSPHVFYGSRNQYNWWGGNTKRQYRNLWDGSARDSIVYEMPIKTPYDPSPPGFVIPPSGAYTGFTRNGIETSDGGNMYKNPQVEWSNTSNDRPLYGWLMSQSGEREGAYHYFPALGHRSSYYYGEVGEINNYGYYWTAHVINTDNAYIYPYALIFNGGSIWPVRQDHWISYAFPVFSCVIDHEIPGLRAPKKK